MKKYADVFNLPALYIDNQKLDGFIEKFINNYDCDLKSCNEYNAIESEEGNTHLCNYCRKWAENSVVFNETEVKKWIDKSEGFLNDLSSSKLF
jgi:hypothetical protein